MEKHVHERASDGNYSQPCPDVVSMTSSYSTLKWVVGICLPVLVLMVGGFYTLNHNSLIAMAVDVKEVKAILVDGQIDNAMLNGRLTAVEADVKELKDYLKVKGGRQ